MHFVKTIAVLLLLALTAFGAYFVYGWRQFENQYNSHLLLLEQLEAVEQYFQASGVLPSPGEFEAYLVERGVPTVDRWGGRTVYHRLDGEGHSVCFVASTGRDGIADVEDWRAYLGVEPYSVDEKWDADLVFTGTVVGEDGDAWLRVGRVATAGK